MKEVKGKYHSLDDELIIVGAGASEGGGDAATF